MDERRPKDRDMGERLWAAGLMASSHFRRWAELYPSVEGRIGDILKRSNPEVASVAALVLARAQERIDKAPPPDAQARFGLTEAEAALAAALAAGEALSAYAARRGVRVQTARNQLQSVFQKVGVNRQSDLVRRLLTAPPK